MSKRRDGKGATFLVFPVIFNILFFLLKPDMSQGAVWVNYAIIQAAYILLSLRSKSGERQLPILGLSLKLVFFWYFIYALVVVVPIAAPPDSWPTPFYSSPRPHRSSDSGNPKHQPKDGSQRRTSPATDFLHPR